MADENPSIISHVSVGVGDLDRAGAFYDAVMATVGAGRIMANGFGIAWGREFPEFWVTLPDDGDAPTSGNGTHVSFLAADPAAVDAFHAAALAHGGTDAGAPGARPHYHAGYYAAFARDPDGNKIEAMAWETVTVEAR